MSSRKAESGGISAAWRIAIWPTVALSAGTAVALTIMYLLIARDIRARSDAWLSGEAEVLADVGENTPRDALYDRLVQEVAELASREVPDISDDSGRHQASVFFLKTTPGQDAIWVGPSPKESFIPSVTNATLLPGTPGNVQILGWKKPFRVVYRPQKDGGGLYLGFADLAAATMLDRLMERCLIVWTATALLGFVITWLAAYRTLVRVEHITETVSRIGSDDLSSRLPEGEHLDEISRLSRTFNNMLDRIQASVSQMRILTDSVAHDVKSPVTSVRGELEAALSKGEQGRWREHVADAIDGLDRLSEWLNTTLDVAEASAGALVVHKQPTDLTQLVEQIAELYQPSMVERGHELRLDLNTVVVNADSSLLARVLTNLLDNEVAHLPPACQICIRVGKKEEDAVLTIEDNGPGFSPAIRERVLERSVKGRNSTGHGLGLAFVNAAVEVHGGDVEIVDRQGGGAQIMIRLPLSGKPSGLKTLVK